MTMYVNMLLSLNAPQLLEDKTVVANDIGVERFLDIVYGLSIIFGALTIGMISFLLINSIIQNKKKKRRHILRERYQDYLADFISIPLKDELTSMGISPIIKGMSKEDISKSENREILLAELYSLRQQLSGYQAEMLKHLFWGWSMHEDVIANLKSNSSNKLIRAIDLVMEFNITDQLSRVKSLVSSNNIDVRSQAMACVISMTSGDISFLKNIPNPLTDWEKHKILSAMMQVKERQAIDLNDWAGKLPVHQLFIEELQLNIQPQFHHYSKWIEESPIE